MEWSCSQCKFKLWLWTRVFKKKTKNSRGLVKAEKMKTQSATSERLNQSLIKDWMVVGGDKSQWGWPEREQALKTFHAKLWKGTLNFLRGGITESRESLNLVRNLICCKRRNLQKALWPPSYFKVSIHQEWHKELLMLQQTATTNTVPTFEKRV